MAGKVVETKSGPGFNISERSTISAVVRRNLTDAKVTALKLGASYAYSELGLLIEDRKIDAIYLATPPGLHYQQALLCIRSGLPVYIEKPFTTSYADARELVFESKKLGVPVFVAHYRRAVRGSYMFANYLEVILGSHWSSISV